ncbi:MAG: PaaI family thioesterase [Geminicoccaceae bacterium]|nr:PaaI family thioesterase [Geminicoccaceae bacterium]MCX8100606.1 PaaI family thioesterase [Geminicoccaceae bacterium]MDW8371692.1 PaaI family thioesterase [Geminicoccaceae bacterium]
MRPSRERLQAALAAMAGRPLTGPFETLLGYRYGWDERAGLTVELDLEERHLSQYGVAHGGVTLVLLDTVGGVAAALAVGDALARIATISLSANFIRPAEPGPVVATARIDHLGRSVAHLVMHLHEGTASGPLLASAIGAYRLFRREG